MRCHNEELNEPCGRSDGVRRLTQESATGNLIIRGSSRYACPDQASVSYSLNGTQIEA